MKQTIKLRTFQEADGPTLVQILEHNGQYGYPEIEGIESMKRVAACEAAIFIVAETEQTPCGFIKGIYDGSRALIHLLTVHPDKQNLGIGERLIKAFRDECQQKGAPSVSVTVTDQSVGYWEKQGFDALPVFVMLQEFSGPSQVNE